VLCIFLDISLAKPLCNFQRGDGVGGREVKIGMQTGNDCVRACIKYKKSNGNVNGVTLLSSNEPGCYCEIGMSSRNSDSKYKTCFLKNQGMFSYSLIQ
jgi:hypothetical protein